MVNEIPYWSSLKLLPSLFLFPECNVFVVIVLLLLLTFYYCFLVSLVLEELSMNIGV